jgi:hypothetical protein
VVVSQGLLLKYLLEHHLYMARKSYLDIEIHTACYQALYFICGLYFHNCIHYGKSSSKVDLKCNHHGHDYDHAYRNHLGVICSCFLIHKHIQKLHLPHHFNFSLFLDLVEVSNLLKHPKFSSPYLG